MTTNSEGKMQKKIGKINFTPQFGGLLFGHLAGLNPHEVGVRAQALGDACTEAVGLDEHGDQLLEVVDTGALGEVAQGFHAAFTGLQFEVDEAELFADLRMGMFQLL